MCLSLQGVHVTNYAEITSEGMVMDEVVVCHGESGRPIIPTIIRHIRPSMVHLVHPHRHLDVKADAPVETLPCMSEVPCSMPVVHARVPPTKNRGAPCTICGTLHCTRGMHHGGICIRVEETSLCMTASKSHEMLVVHSGRGKDAVPRADLDARVADPHGLAPDVRLEARVHHGGQSRHLVGGRHT